MHCPSRSSPSSAAAIPPARAATRAFDFAQSLARRGLAITSGLAEGIDAAAHRGRARGAGNHARRARHRRRSRVSARQSRACAGPSSSTERSSANFPWERAPRRGNFPRRNRLIAGLTHGNSGGRGGAPQRVPDHRARGRELGREVFAVPGSIHNPLKPRLPRTASSRARNWPKLRMTY